LGARVLGPSYTSGDSTNHTVGHFNLLGNADSTTYGIINSTRPTLLQSLENAKVLKKDNAITFLDDTTNKVVNTSLKNIKNLTHKDSISINQKGKKIYDIKDYISQPMESTVLDLSSTDAEEIFLDRRLLPNLKTLYLPKTLKVLNFPNNELEDLYIDGMYTIFK
jgi:hypothetical protein